MGELIAKWEAMQTKTFTAWVNMHLAKRGKKIESVLTDLGDGVSLIHLLEIIGEGTIPKFVATPVCVYRRSRTSGRPSSSSRSTT
jgi:hypothetical protein